MMIFRRLYSRQSVSHKYLKKTKHDPGIRSRSRLLEPSEDIENVDFEELESDFMNVQKSHKDHVEEMKQWREKEKYLIVKQKYFKEKFPNFLTWHDKEQIRYLHNTDSTEWSIEKLSESFPALPDIIEKVVKSKWTKKNDQKIVNHDKTVMSNWAEFKQGKLNNLPDELKVHLQKFSSRSLNLKPFDPKNNQKTIRQASEKVGEFSEIIQSYERLKKNSDGSDQRTRESENIKPLAETKKINKISKDPYPLTLTQLKEKIRYDISKGKTLSEDEKVILNNVTISKTDNINTVVELKPENVTDIVDQRYKTSSDKVGFVKKTNKDMSHLKYPERIIIPKKAYVRGYTYKLNDCYYDSDGTFLYRVPGMG
ncbi:neugrin [Sitophilus oryzae]|uniref:Neugrin n=1 Tax=Sitophilus oryzae TaxID=7048 RepID=A0A6J2Y1I9_SITOR|nr:neugrin [Sitophilus oryzae]